MLLMLFLLSCVVKKESDLEVRVTITEESLVKYKIIPDNFFNQNIYNDINSNDKNKISLGKMLFDEKSLFLSKKYSCSDCHDLNNGGTTDNDTLDIKRNPLSIFNAAGNKFLNWDGSYTTVEEQIVSHLSLFDHNNDDVIITTLKSKDIYTAEFSKAFEGDLDPINMTNIGIALGSYVRTLSTPSRWDLFLEGDINAISNDEKSGFILFNSIGCGTCHAGQLLGGYSLMKLGLSNPWPDHNDFGRFDITGDETDKFVFKTPSLRNSAVTGPYFHDGSVKELDEAIKKMGYHQLGISISDHDAKMIEVWLESTTGIISNK